MDFTFLLLVILMLLSLQMGQALIAGGLFIILLFSSKSKMFLIVGLVGVAAAAVYLLGFENVNPVFVIIGLFIVLVVSLKAPAPEQGPEAYYPGGAGGYA